MDSKVHPLVAALVIAVAVVAIGLWVWGSGEAKKIGGPGQLIVTPSGHLYVQMQDTLLEHDEDGKFVARHELADIGAGGFPGGIGVFSNGDLLLRRGDDARSLLDDLRAYQRRTNEDSLDPESADAGLYRCSLERRQCETFGTTPIDFKATYHVAVDRQTDAVYVADTTRHLLRKFAADGEPLAAPAGRFRFPNRLRLIDDRLYVADTNNHRIVAVDPSDDAFGNEIASFDVVPSPADRAGHVWPSYFARVGDEWWVNLMRSGMNEGGIYVFDALWRYVRQVDLPVDADPIDLQVFNNAVLISDWNNDTVYRVSLDGFLVGVLESEGLDALVAESVDARWQYQVYAYLGIGLFVFLLAAMLVKGLATPSASRSAARRETAAVPAFPEELIWLEPDPVRVRKLNSLVRIIGILFFFLFVMSGLLLFVEACRPFLRPLVWPFGGMLVVYAIVAWVTRVNVKTAIGLKGQHITLRDHRGQEKTFPLHELIFDGATIAAGDMAVFLGQPVAPIYDRQQLMEHLFPRLAHARSVSAWQMQSQLFRLRHAQAVLVAVSLLALAAAAAYLMVRNL